MYFLRPFSLVPFGVESTQLTLWHSSIWQINPWELLDSKRHQPLLNVNRMSDWNVDMYFLCSFCLKALHSRPPCAKLCWLRIKVKAVLSSWVNGLSAPQNGKSGWGNPLRLKNDIYKKAQIFDLKKQTKSLILAPESSYLHRFEYSYVAAK